MLARQVRQRPFDAFLGRAPGEQPVAVRDGVPLRVPRATGMQFDGFPSEGKGGRGSVMRWALEADMVAALRQGLRPAIAGTFVDGLARITYKEARAPGTSMSLSCYNPVA